MTQPTPDCASTTVEAKTNSTTGQPVMINGIAHAAVVTHRCGLQQGHAEVCRCACGHTWLKFLNVK